MGKLTAKKVAGLKAPGFYGDGDGLYLKVGRRSGKSWILRTVVHGRRRDIGLGSSSLTPLAEAREAARTCRRIARRGGDPLASRGKREIAFTEAARLVHAQNLPAWRNAKHAAAWLSTLERHAFPAFGNRLIHTVGTADVLAILGPIWTVKNETARRLKQRLSTVFDWAKGNGYYPHENPVNGVEKSLPKVKQVPEHMAALPWRAVPEFMAELGRREGVSARTLEFIVLTAARSGEARGARWEEVDFRARTWTVPGARMKRGREHRVPLSDAAVAVLEQQRGLDPDYIFPSPSRGADGRARPQSVMVFKALMKRMGRVGFTVHGFRSAFRDWCGETGAAREVAEIALAHAVGGSVERAYARSDLFERRRALMDAWAVHATGAVGKVVRIARI